jgi:hypothetical protein
VSNAVHVLAAVQQAHEHAKYYPMTAKDKSALEEAGIFAAAVAVVIGFLQMVRGGSRKAATGRN